MAEDLLTKLPAILCFCLQPAIVCPTTARFLAGTTTISYFMAELPAIGAVQGKAIMLHSVCSLLLTSY